MCCNIFGFISIIVSSKKNISKYLWRVELNLFDLSNAIVNAVNTHFDVTKFIRVLKDRNALDLVQDIDLSICQPVLEAHIALRIAIRKYTRSGSYFADAAAHHAHRGVTA